MKEIVRRKKLWRPAGIIRCVVLLIAALTFALRANAQPDTGQGTPEVPPQVTPMPIQVQELLKLMEDPAVRAWIDQQRSQAALPSEAVPQSNVSEVLAMRVVGAREHLIALAAAVPRLPQEAQQAADLLSQELRSRPIFDIVLLVAGFLGLGAGTEWIFGRVTTAREKSLPSPANTVSIRMQAISRRLVFGLARVAIFGLGSIGAFLVFEWPPLLRRIVLVYLFAALVLKLALLGGRILLVPTPASKQEAELYRIVPVTDEAALFWYRRLALFVGWFILGWATVSFLHTVGFSPDGRRLIAYTLGLGLLTIAAEAVWRRPRVISGDAESGLHHKSWALLMSLYLLLLWGLWVMGLMGLFWILVVAVLLPRAVAIARLSSHNLLRPPDGAGATPEHHLHAIYLDRGLRALLVAGAAIFLAYAWDIDLVVLASRDTLLTRLARGMLSSIVILLVADLIWQIVKTQIDRKLAQARILAPPGSEEALRQARLRTLLPILRNTVFVVLAVVAVLMALSALGVEIGPLIAGAGIVGVAVGFGSQTLVKDVISGIFYLLDDAFRVGEYIQSGTYKGTVEALGFRSVKLRHHRGYVYTVPFGQLGAVENMSRDWVIDKMTINVTYDTNLDQAKRIIKQIGKELAADPDLAPNILEPLKMQGVEQFGDFAIQLRLKIMTRPGEQFAIRRRAYAMIKKAFDENGIKFAFPTVQVSGKEDAEPAAAGQVLTLVKGKTPEGGE